MTVVSSALELLPQRDVSSIELEPRPRLAIYDVILLDDRANPPPLLSPTDLSDVALLARRRAISYFERDAPTATCISQA